MAQITTQEPSARMMAVLNRSLKDRGIEAKYSETLAPFATSAKSIEMVADGFKEFLAAAQPFLSQGELDLGEIVASASDNMRTAKSSSDVTTLLCNALIEAEGDRGAKMGVASFDARAPGNMTVAEFRRSEVPFGPALVARMTDGFLARVKPDHRPTIGTEFASMSLLDIARYTLQANGMNLYGRSKASIVEMAMHSTSDFPSFLVDSGRRLLVDAYEAADSGIKVASQELQVQDFRAVHNLRLGAAPDLEAVAEHGEVKYGTIEEAKESIKIDTYAKIFAITRQAIVNDDLSAFDRLIPEMGSAAARKEGMIFAALLEENAGDGPTMADGQPLFDASHGNIASSGSAISVATISAARTAMRRQKGLSGEPINVTPAFLIVPPELETEAQRVVAQIQAAQVADANPFTGRLEVVVDPYLSDQAKWYVTARPGRPVGLQHAYLQGEAGPQIFTSEGFDVEGLKVKVRLDFGAGFADHRAWYMNPGV